MLFGHITTKGDKYFHDNSKRNIDLLGPNLLSPAKHNLRSSKLQRKQNFITFCSDEASLQKEIEAVIMQINNCSRKYAQIIHEWEQIKSQLKTKKEKFDKETPTIQLETHRINVKCRNIQRDIKCSQWSTSLSKADNYKVKLDLEDDRRINMKYNRHMMRTSNNVNTKRNLSQRATNQTIQSRVEINSLLMSCRKMEDHSRN